MASVAFIESIGFVESIKSIAFIASLRRLHCLEPVGFVGEECYMTLYADRESQRDRQSLEVKDYDT